MARFATVGLLTGTILALVACGAGGENPGPAGETGGHATGPGEFVRQIDVGGYGLWLGCEGTGSPTVILEAGLGADGTSTWSDFRGFASDFARVCSYERAGLGSSDLRPEGVGPAG